MFFSDWRMLLRRWYAVLAGLAVTFGLCFAAAQVVRPSYEIKAMLLVLPPKTTVGEGGNPFLSLGGLDSVADVVSRAMMDGETVKSLVKLGANDQYTVAQDTTSAGPVILITSTAPTSAEASQTLEIVKTQIPVKLRTLQKSSQVPSKSLITLSSISQDERPAIIRKSQLRALFAALAAGIGATVVMTGLIDNALTRRSRSAKAATAPDPIVVDGLNPALRLKPIIRNSHESTPRHDALTRQPAPPADLDRLAKPPKASDATLPAGLPQRQLPPHTRPEDSEPPSTTAARKAGSVPDPEAAPTRTARAAQVERLAEVFDLDRLPPAFRTVRPVPPEGTAEDQSQKDGTG